MMGFFETFGIFSIFLVILLKDFLSGGGFVPVVLAYALSLESESQDGSQSQDGSRDDRMCAAVQNRKISY